MSVESQMIDIGCSVLLICLLDLSVSLLLTLVRGKVIYISRIYLASMRENRADLFSNLPILPQIKYKSPSYTLLPNNKQENNQDFANQTRRRLQENKMDYNKLCLSFLGFLHFVFFCDSSYQYWRLSSYEKILLMLIMDQGGGRGGREVRKVVVVLTPYLLFILIYIWSWTRLLCMFLCKMRGMSGTFTQKRGMTSAIFSIIPRFSYTL